MDTEFLEEKLGKLIDDIVEYADANNLDRNAFAQKVAVMFKVTVDIFTFNEYTPRESEE